MKITRMYRGNDGLSHFEDVDVALKFFDVGGMSRRMFPGHAFFRLTDPGLLIDWHTTPGKRMIIVLEGVVEVEAGHGEKRRFGPGEICLAEDVDGPGHRTTDVEGPRLSLMIDLPDDWDLKHWARQFEDAS